MGRKARAARSWSVGRQSIRVSAGPWTACVKTAATGDGRVFLAFGRVAGGAVTRSRIRRIARNLVATQPGCLKGADLLLLARSDVSRQPRRQVRTSLAGLLERVGSSLTQHAFGKILKDG